MTTEHTAHTRLAERTKAGPHLTKHEKIGFNGWVATVITNAVGTMWCAYIFALIALISLPDAIKAGTAALVAWVAQTFLQLVLLSVIMVGQKVSAAASDKQALQTYKDAEALLKIQDELHKLMTINNELTAEIHAASCPKLPDTVTAAEIAREAGLAAEVKRAAKPVPKAAAKPTVKKPATRKPNPKI